MYFSSYSTKLIDHRTIKRKVQKRVNDILSGFLYDSFMLIVIPISFLTGGLFSWIYQNQRFQTMKNILKQTTENLQKETQIVQEMRGKLLEETEKRAVFETKCQNLAEKIIMLEETEIRLMTTFKALSADALKSNNQSFLDLAVHVLGKFHEQSQGDLKERQKSIEEMVTPLKETLKGLDHKIGEVEKSRVGAYEGLKQQIHDLLMTQKELKKETTDLVKALRTPHIRGRWGEIQLKRVVEMAGMLSHCDFLEQVHGEDDMARKMRPDMVIHLPGGKNIVIDAKVPLMAYLESLEAPDEAHRVEKLKEHARHVKSHVMALSQRSYWEQFPNSPEFVVLFLPGEPFFSAALDQDPALIEMGVEQKVILATPTTLIALLRAVSYGWRQEKMAENAHKIASLGRDLYKRLEGMGKHFTRLGRSLSGSVDAYNQTVATFESRVLISARRFKDLETVSAGSEIETLVPLDSSIRKLQSVEFFDADESSETNI